MERIRISYFVKRISEVEIAAVAFGSFAMKARASSVQNCGRWTGCYDFIPAPASAGVTILRGHKHFRFYIELRFFAALRMTGGRLRMTRLLMSLSIKHLKPITDSDRSV